MRFRVRGRVQGVGFRWWTQQEAVRLGLAGRVRNCRDGSVEVVAQGSAEAVETLRRRLASGPPGAEVVTVEVHPEQDRPSGDGFRITS